MVILIVYIQVETIFCKLGNLLIDLGGGRERRYLIPINLLTQILDENDFAHSEDTLWGRFHELPSL